jgi:Cu(I)/Ag(I) efflux system membrane fusion protein/cobalt-zinc-cadmium efflux system membrane fusion protein
MTTEVKEHTAPDPFARSGKASVARAIVTFILIAGAFAIGFVMRGTLHGHDEHAAAPSTAATQTKQLWTCGMHPQVIQDHPGKCPICHMELTPLKTDSAQATASAERKVKYWWDPMMNPPYISQQPGKSPMGMQLIPVYEDEVKAGTGVTIDPVIVQNMGVRTAPVVFGSIQQQERVVVYLAEPEPLHRDINLRVNGWIEKLYADTDGMAIKKGQPLFELYSPEIQVAVEELIAARRSRDSASDDQAKRMADTLFESTSKKLELWGLEKQQVAELAKADRAPHTVTFLAPIGGHLTEKRVYEGAGVQSGMLVMRLADRKRMWIDAQVYEQQLPLVKIGCKAKATIVSEPGKVYEGEVVFIHPHIDPATRTALVRIQIPNEDYELRQGMYAMVDLLADPTPPAAVVPREAVIDTGTRQIAFVALGGGRFEPRTVKLGLSGRDGLVQVLSGLAPNEQVVTSGQFLLDSESRLKEAIQKHLETNLAAKSPPPLEHVHDLMPSPATTPMASPAQQLVVPHTDDIAAAYLQIAEALGAVQQSDASIGVEAVVASSSQAAEHSDGEGKALAQAVHRAAEAMKGKSIGEQRKLFVALSDAVIALLDRSPPSAQTAAELYVNYCPMAFEDKGALWLQRYKPIANPYYGTEMKSCGELKRAIVAKK